MHRIVFADGRAAQIYKGIAQLLRQIGMFDSFLIRQDSLENVEQEGVVIGFRFGVRIADYRGCILSLHNGYYVEVDGKKRLRQVFYFAQQMRN